MKTRIKTLLSLLLVLPFFIFGCNQLKKDWEKTKQTNSVEEVKRFLAKNPASEFDLEAKYFLDSLEWISILKTKNVDSLELFVKNHSKGQFLSNSKYAIDSINKIEWTPNLISESENIFKLIFPTDTILSYIALKQNYHWNNEEFVYSIGKMLAVGSSQNGSSYAIAARDEGHSISCNFTDGVTIIGDFAFGNLKFFNTHASGKEGGILFTKGTELVFSIPKGKNSSK